MLHGNMVALKANSFRCACQAAAQKLHPVAPTQTNAYRVTDSTIVKTPNAAHSTSEVITVTVRKKTTRKLSRGT